MPKQHSTLKSNEAYVCVFYSMCGVIELIVKRYAFVHPAYWERSAKNHSKSSSSQSVLSSKEKRWIQQFIETVYRPCFSW